MLKHPDLTQRRIDLFLKTELEERLIGARHPLKIEYCDTAHANQADAKKGPWVEVEKGFRYGPAYRTVWFRLTGKVPAAFDGCEIGVLAEVGAERTVWRDNSPWRGVDVQHYVFPYNEAAGIVPFDPKGSRKVEIYIQAYTRNAQVRVHLREPEREATVEVVDRAELVVTDRELSGLYYDVAFARDLLGAIEHDAAAHATILRALNDVCNAFDPHNRATLGRCRRLLHDALGTLPGEIKHEITPVGHAHLDTAWLWPLEITRKKMAHTTATQLALMDEYPEYVFAHSQASQYEWLEKEYPALFARVKDAIRRKQWEVVGSMWVEADCNLTGAESLVRQFLYGKRYFREKLGVETDDMWLPDVFGYSAALPQVLVKFGIDYFLTQKICWNQFNKFPHHTFWWQGIDGSKVWSHFPPSDTYCGDCTPTQILKSVKNYKDHGRADQSLYVFGFGDGGGGPTEKHIELLRRARHAPGLPDILANRRAIDFFRDAKAQSKDLMTWVGELYLEIHRGTYTSQAANKRGNRKSEFLLRDAELLACFRENYPRSYPSAELEKAWKLVLLNQFHDIIPGSSVREVYEESDRDYATIAEIGERIVSESLEKIGGKLDTSACRRPYALFQNATTVTEGSIPWPRGDAPNSLVCGEDVLPVQLVDGHGERRLVFPTPTEALGSVTVGDLSAEPAPKNPTLRAKQRRIESDEFAVRFDAHGNITGIQNLEDGSEYVEPGKLANCFQLFEDKPLFWSAWDIELYAFETGVDLVRSERFEIVERGPARVAVEVEKRFGKSRITQRISLGPTPGIRFETEVDWHEEDKLLKVAFPVNVNSQRATYEIQFGSVERPTHQNTTWDVAKFEVCAQKWVDLSEGDHGVALLNDCKYGHDVHGNVIRLSLLRAPKAPDPLCDMGLHRFTYVLMPHFGPHHYAGVVQAAYALNAPLRSAKLRPSVGEQGRLPAFVSCDDRNIVVETVKKAEVDGAVIVRLYECHNARGSAELFCARAPKSAWLCDMEENPISELEVHEGLVLFDYKPFEIHTVRVEC